MSAPRFSIVTPSYKQLDWLKLCIASVRDQVSAGTPDRSTCAGLQNVSVEHIIQDNCTPGIDRLACELGAELHLNGRLVSHDRVHGPNVGPARYTLRIYSEPDQGMYDAVNQGFRRASGDFLAFLNADDQYLENSLSEVACFFANHPRIDMVFGDALIVGPQGEYLCTRIVSKPTRLVTGLHTLSIFTAATFFRRALLTEHNLYFDAGWKVIGDAIWILAHLRAGTRMGLIGKPLAAATETGGNMILSPLARQESARLRRLHPKLMRLFKPLFVVHYRLRRWMQGAYFPKSCNYAIYTGNNLRQRACFTIGKATHRLKGRFG